MKFFDILGPGKKPVPFDFGTSENPKSEIFLGEQRENPDESIIISGEGNEVAVKRGHNGILVKRCLKLKEDDKCFVLIHVTACFTSYRENRISDSRNIQIEMTGTIEFKQDGKMSGKEYLAIASPGAYFQISGRFITAHYTWDGKKWLYWTEEN